jgi:pimeloyl-ACP methyl ester carboxylesterase
MTDLPMDSVKTHSAVQNGYASVNGLKLYYEINGAGSPGTPLILLHGGLGTVEMFKDILPSFTKCRRVIGVDLQAHGRTADIDRPLSFELMADDIAGMIRLLGFEQADIFGYSLGGGVALQTAIRHSQVVRKLVLVSAPYKRDGWYPEVLIGMSQMGPEAAKPMKQSPIYEAYARLAPRREDWPLLLAKLGQLLRQPYDWSEEVNKIHAPTLIVIGDADSIRPAHAVEFFELLGGGKKEVGWDGSGMPKSRLAILPATTHYNVISNPVLGSLVTPFLDEPVL